ncbi:hypothetical protein ACFPM0_36630 [Pseudonocardia sulfidoxydans]|uniref:hypothetical protein n=1 Tax=Pseudonocardia sulfidoxydans TaxID=54011 RepID=UPI003618365D
MPQRSGLADEAERSGSLPWTVSRSRALGTLAGGRGSGGTMSGSGGSYVMEWASRVRAAVADPAGEALAGQPAAAQAGAWRLAVVAARVCQRPVASACPRHVRQGAGPYVTSLEPTVLLSGLSLVMDLM